MTVDLARAFRQDAIGDVDRLRTDPEHAEASYAEVLRLVAAMNAEIQSEQDARRALDRRPGPISDGLIDKLARWIAKLGERMTALGRALNTEAVAISVGWSGTPTVSLTVTWRTARDGGAG